MYLYHLPSALIGAWASVQRRETRPALSVSEANRHGEGCDAGLGAAGLWGQALGWGWGRRGGLGGTGGCCTVLGVGGQVSSRISEIER